MTISELESDFLVPGVQCSLDDFTNFQFITAPESGNTVEIDCTHPEIRVSPAHRRTVEIDIVPATNTVHSSPVPVSSSASTDSRMHSSPNPVQVKMRRNPSEEASPPARGGGCTSAPIAFRYSMAHTALN